MGASAGAKKSPRAHRAQGLPTSDSSSSDADEDDHELETLLYLKHMDKEVGLPSPFAHFSDC